MKNWINYCGAGVLIVLMACASCRQQTTLRSEVILVLDSVFINAYEFGSFDDVPYIFFFYTLKNNSEDSIHFTIRRWPTDALGPDRAFCLYGTDTIELFAGNLSTGHVSLASQEQQRIDLNLDPDALIDLLNDKGDKFATEQELMKNIATNGAVHLESNDILFKDLSISRNLKFRNPYDSAIYEWK